MDEYTPLYQHTKRPEWGYGAIAEVHGDRTTFKFADGSSRAISREYLHMMLEVELAEPEASDVRKRIGKLAPRPTLPEGKAKKKSSAKKAAAPR